MSTEKGLDKGLSWESFLITKIFEKMRNRPRRWIQAERKGGEKEESLTEHRTSSDMKKAQKNWPKQRRIGGRNSFYRIYIYIYIEEYLS